LNQDCQMWLRKLYRLSGLAVAVLTLVAYIVGFILGEKSLAFFIILLALLFAVSMAISALVEAAKGKSWRSEVRWGR